MNIKNIAFVNRWQQLPPQTKRVALVGALLAGIVFFIVTLVWLNSELVRLRRVMPIAEASYQQVKNDIAEIQQLKLQPIAISLTGRALTDEVVASLHRSQMALTVTSIDSDHLRLQGAAGFDNFIIWMGTAYKDYGLKVTRLTMTQQGNTTAIDADLASIKP